MPINCPLSAISVLFHTPQFQGNILASKALLYASVDHGTNEAIAIQFAVLYLHPIPAHHCDVENKTASL